MPDDLRADFKVEVVNGPDNPEADHKVEIVGGAVVDLTNAHPGDVLVVQPDGSLTPIAALPWLVDIDVRPKAVAQTGWDGLAAATASTWGAQKFSNGAQNDEINWDVVLAAGTWDLELTHVLDAFIGIYTITLVGPSTTIAVGTIDGYSASHVEDHQTIVTGIVVPTAAKYRLKLKMATKNASAAAYTGDIQHLQLRRTA